MQQTMKRRFFFRPMSEDDARARLSRINQNPDNTYRTGYEHYMDHHPIIHSIDDLGKQTKLIYIEFLLSSIGRTLLKAPWVHEDWPADGKMLNRVILAIDEVTGGELVMVRWNIGETPIHGHQNGQMIDFLLQGDAKEVEYEISNMKRRWVHQIGYAEFHGFGVLSNDFYPETDLSRASLIHKFVAITKCITLHFIPEHPRDGRGNIFNEPKI